MKTKIAFIGLGNMGGPMAANLAREPSYTVAGFDVSKPALLAFDQAGGVVCESVEEACRDAEVVITMLPSGTHVAQVLSEELLRNLQEQTLLIDSSTIDPATSRQVATLAKKCGLAMVDAPVSGGTAGAKNGTLTFIVGGEETDLKRAEPFLERMGKNIFHAGPSGSGQVAKICNNMLLAIHMIGTSEALNLGVSQGLDPKVLSDIMRQSSGGNWSLEVYNPHPGVMENVPAARNYSGGFSVDLMAKDLGLASEASLGSQSTIPLGEMARNLYLLWSQRGQGGLDFSSIFKFLAAKGT